VAIVRHHHEKWNGQGYPDGLARTAIPLGSRIIAVADTFDALTASRAYHKSRSISQALRILTDSTGYELDPDAVSAIVTWFVNIGRQCQKDLEHLTLDDLHRWPSVRKEPEPSDGALSAQPVVSAG
jgi:HD-GYP domain-containing protein (c-di-GMP phosphodiesterase class II)